jgi:hypothetical protein
VKTVIEAHFKVPAISWCGADEWHGEWTVSRSNGSLTDEPFVIANLLAQRDRTRVGVSCERSIYGHDVGQAFVAALARAEPLSPRGVMEALERWDFDVEPDDGWITAGFRSSPGQLSSKSSWATPPPGATAPLDTSGRWFTHA